MPLSVSPDVPAWVAYAIVLLVGILVARKEDAGDADGLQTEKVAEYLFGEASIDVQFTDVLRREEISTWLTHIRFVASARNKVYRVFGLVVLLVAVSVAALAFDSAVWGSNYALLRLQKRETTAGDRFRTENAIRACLADREHPDRTKGMRRALIEILRAPDTSPESMELALGLLLEQRENPEVESALPELLIPALRTSSTAASARLCGALILLAAERSLEVPSDLANCAPANVAPGPPREQRIRRWKHLFGGAGSEASVEHETTPAGR